MIQIFSWIWDQV